MIKKRFRVRLKKLIIFLKQNFYFYFYLLLPYYYYFLKGSNLNNNIYLYINSNNLYFLSFFFKNFQFFQINNITDLVVIDNYNKKKRFKLVYNFLSLIFSFRIFLVYFLKDVKPVSNSLISLFPAIDWLEREAWDLFGIFFLQHNDLRRILTDYGFKGFPFRKDFPLTGYIELRFDDFKQDIVYEPVELSQELRFFNFSSSWEKNY